MDMAIIKTRKPKIWALLALAYTTSLFVPANSVAQSYSVTELGSLGGVTKATAINNSGQVTGGSNAAIAEPMYAFLYSNSVMLPLTTAGRYSVGQAINDSGQVVGRVSGYGLPDHAFLYSNGTFQDIGSLGPVGSDAIAINSSGQITGSSYPSGSKYAHAFLYSNGVMQDLGTLGGYFSAGVAINGSGQIAGAATTTSGALDPFLYSNGVMQDLGTFGGTYSEVAAINASGQVTGGSSTAGNSALHAFLYGTGLMHDLGTLGGTSSRGNAINDSGLVTGYAFTTTGAMHAFVYSGGVMRDLGTLGGKISVGKSINGSGQIVGAAYTTKGTPHGFLFDLNGYMVDINTLIAKNPIAAYVTITSAIAITDSGSILAEGTDTRRDTATWYVLQLPPLVAGNITTVAGDGQAGGGGDGGPATLAGLNQPYGIAVDSQGDLYIADFLNSRIRKVANGVISTIAGNGAHGFSGDGGAATAASLFDPFGVAVDSVGNLYISDFNNHRVRMVNISGTITTIAGNGIQGFSGDGGLATAASLNTPYGVAVSASGDLYIADPPRIRKVTAGGIITTVAGNGTQGFSGDGGPATAAGLKSPYGVAVDTNGNIYIADEANQRIRKVSSSGVITTVAGNGTQGFSGDGGPATAASLNYPAEVVVDNMGYLYIADTLNQRIRVVNTSGVITTIVGNGITGSGGDGGPATSANLDDPVGVALDTAANLYIADSANYSIREVPGVTMRDQSARHIQHHR